MKQRSTDKVKEVFHPTMGALGVAMKAMSGKGGAGEEFIPAPFRQYMFRTAGGSFFKLIVNESKFSE